MKTLGYIGGYKTSKPSNNKIEIRFIDFITDTKEEALKFKDKKDFWYHEIKVGDSEKIILETDDVYEEFLLPSQPFPKELADSVSPEVWEMNITLVEFRWHNTNAINLNEICKKYIANKLNLKEGDVQKQLTAIQDYLKNKYDEALEKAFGPASKD